jgi:glucokinase
VAGEVNKFLGIDVGAGSFKASLADVNGNVHLEHSIPIDRLCSNSSFLDSVISLTNYFFEKDKPSAIGIGTPGPLDIDKGIIISSANLPGLRNVPLVETLKNKFKVPVYSNNDANCAALGEYYFGKSRQSKSLVILTLGSGLGGGWVVDGRLFNGHLGNAMEVGHTTIVKDGALCGCGQKGCTEAYFSTRGFINRYKETTGMDLINAEEFFTLVKSGDKSAIQVFDFAVDVFAECIKNIIHTVNPDRIALVGGISHAFDLFETKLNKKISEITFPVLFNYTEIVVGSNIAGSLGAAALCF